MLAHPHADWVRVSGFSQPEALICLFVGGSELHGAKVGATDDLDLYGVFLETPAQALGLVPLDHLVWSTAADDRRNGPEDVDLTLYSLRRWAGLAAKGTATALHFLFAGATMSSTPGWDHVLAQRSAFLSRQSAAQFLGFAENQRKCITGELGRGIKDRRPEYECAHGYDTKAAMHCLRLLLECKELMQDGTITLPRPEREFLIAVRRGDRTLAEFIAEADRLRSEAEAAAAGSPLPETVDRERISRLLAEVHLEAWRS